MLETRPDEGNITERVVPVGNLQLMFHYRKPFTMKYPDTKAWIQPQSFVSGLSNQFMDATTQGPSGVIAVEFHPYGASSFFHFPLNEIENKSIHLEDIFPGEIRYLEEQMNECSDTQNRITLIEEFLKGKINSRNTNDSELTRKAVKLIQQSGGQIQACQLAARFSVTPKNLERKFGTLIGKSPKQFIRIIRFQEVMNGLVNRQQQHLTEYAFNNGYFDQSHFIHEFKAFSGYTPLEFVKLCPCGED